MAVVAVTIIAYVILFPSSIAGTATSCRERDSDEKYHQNVEGPSHQGEHFVTTATVTTILSSCSECDCLLQYQNQLTMGPETVEEVKKGLQFGHLIQLPSNLTFSSMHMVDLLVSEGCVRPFLHIRYMMGS